jgi:hypothetical protein
MKELALSWLLGALDELEFDVLLVEVVPLVDCDDPKIGLAALLIFFSFKP